MSGEDVGPVIERKQFTTDPIEQNFPVAAREIPSADALAKEDVPSNEGVFFGEKEAQAAGTMTGNMEDFHRHAEEVLSSFRDQKIGREGLDLELKSPFSKKISVFGHGRGLGVEGGFAVVATNDGRRVCDVVEVPVREQEKVDGGVGERGICPLGGVKKDVSASGFVVKTIGIEDAAGKEFELIHGKVVSKNI
jgi:hypothetical protein